MQHDSGNQRGEGIADCPGALHNGNCFGAQFCGPGFGYQRGAGVPFASHAEAQDEAKHRQHQNRSRQARSEGADGVGQDAEHQRALSPDAVRNKAEQHSADTRSQQSQRIEQPEVALLMPGRA